jgi:DNA-binding NtrC family response regulator
MNSDCSPSQRHILIVDDAEESREVLAIALRTIEGAIVETSGDPREALRSIGSQPVDVLITDIRMDGMNGFELLAALRESGGWPSCGAVVVSGETDPELPSRALACGAAMFFGKPVSASAIRKSVHSLLEGKHGAR